MPGLASLSRSLQTKLSERKSPVILTEIDRDGKIVKPKAGKTGNGYLAFQYFPETITDTKAIGYQTRDIPGGSLPLYQWMSSGERTITFTAYFTSDVDLTQDKELFGKLGSKGHARRNVDLRSALTWLRRFMYPSYESEKPTAEVGVPLTFAPKKLLLWIPNSGIGLLGGDTTIGVHAADDTTNSLAAIVRDEVLCVMTQCDITYEAFFPSGLPRIASAQLAFAQVAQRGGTVFFPQDSTLMTKIVEEGSNTHSIYPYPIKVSFK